MKNSPPNRSLLGKFERDLSIQESRFLKHIKKKHKGYPVDNCHDCGYYIQAIMNDKDVINNLQKNRQFLPQNR